jgi:hypothetical protein
MWHNSVEGYPKVNSFRNCRTRSQDRDKRKDHHKRCKVSSRTVGNIEGKEEEEENGKKLHVKSHVIVSIKITLHTPTNEKFPLYNNATQFY